jgi:protein angel
MDLVDSESDHSTTEPCKLHEGFEHYFASGALKHKLNLTSAYSHQYSNQREASTFQNEWITVDYVFYSRQMDAATQTREDGYLKMLANYRLPTQQHCSRIGMIPNKYLGSDHLSLSAHFLLQSPNIKSKS